MEIHISISLKLVSVAQYMNIYHIDLFYFLVKVTLRCCQKMMCCSSP